MFDPRRGELRRDGAATLLTPQALGLLTYLLDHRDRDVSRDELLAAVWKGVVVSDGALSTAMYELRIALGDDGRQQQVVRTLRGRGFRFVAQVEESAADPSAAPEPAPAPPIRAPTDTQPAGNAPFVGRQRWLARLRGALTAAAGGRGRLILLAGEAGIGKTTLAQHFASVAPAARVLWGRCYEHAGAPPFWPWMQILREPVAAVDPAELRRLFGTRAALIGLTPQPHRVSLPACEQSAAGAEARFQLFDAVAGLLRSAGAAAPLLLILDDIHCADTSSLLLLEFLAAELAAARVLMLATFRSEEVEEAHALAATLGQLARHAHVERLQLGGLEPAEVGALLTTIANGPVSAATVDRIVRRSEGNPLYVKELARQLDGQGADGGPSYPVLDIVRRRIARLAPSIQQALGVAAVLGREFRLDVLARMWDGAAPLPFTWLDEAVRAQVVSLTQPGCARFAHALFQEILHDRLDHTRRSVLHRRAGEVLEALLPAPAGADLAALAHHFSEALAGGGDAARAVAYCLAAARAASELLAYDEAVQHYRRAAHAIEWGGVPDPIVHAEVLLGLGEAQDHAGDACAARQTFIQAASLARRAGDAALLARAALGHGAARDAMLRIDGDAGEESARLGAAALLSEALAALESAAGGGAAGEAHPALHARVAAALAVAATDRAAEVRERLSGAAVARAEQLGDPSLLAEVIAARRELLWSPNNVEDRLAMATAIVGLAQRTGDRERELRGRAWRLTDLLELGELARVRDEMESCDRLAGEIGQLKYRHLVAVLRVTLAILDGRFAAAERLTYEALALGRRIRSEFADALFVVHLSTLRREQGGLEEIEAMVRDAVVKHPVFGMRCMLAYILGEMDRLDEARAHFELLAREDFADLPRDRNFLATVVILAQLCVRLGDRARAATLYELILPFAERNVVAVEGASSLGAAAHQLGMLATLLKRWDAAERHFQAALAMNARVGAFAFLGQIQLAYATMLLARRMPGDRVRGLALLEDARATAERFGSHLLHRRVLAARANAVPAVALPPVSPRQDPIGTSGRLPGR